MAAPVHVNRHVDTVQNIDLVLDEEKILKSITRHLTQGDLRWVIVMPSQGVIHALRTAYTCSESKEDTHETLSAALRALGFFTEAAPPMDIPKEIVTPVEGADPQYRVEITIYPERKTTYKLMK